MAGKDAPRIGTGLPDAVARPPVRTMGTTAGRDEKMIDKQNKYVFGTTVETKSLGRTAWLNDEKIKWFLPCFFAGVGFYCQSVGLHWATYQYIHKYGAAPKEYRTLYDSIEPDTREPIDMGTIDKVAGLIPMLFMVLTAFRAFPLCFSKVFAAVTCCSRTPQSNVSRHMPYTQCFSKKGPPTHTRHDFLRRQNVLRIWTKVMTCATFLFMWKGILGAITVVPDSSGWSVCENRLKKEGMDWMRQDHSFYDMLFIDATWVSEHHAPLRYCADMMFSGHTFVVTLFALGTYEMMRALPFDDVFRGDGGVARNLQWKAVVKMSVLTVYACLVVLEQGVEVWFVERSHFHYSMDVFMAIILTFLIYTNGVIAVFSKHWTTWGLLIFIQWRGAKREEDAVADVELADVWGPESPADFYTTDPKQKEWALLNSRGDIFIPPCCFPFCFYSGREHIYSDEGIMEIVKSISDKDTSHAFRGPDGKDKSHVIRKYLENTMMLDEGVSMSEFQSVKRMVSKPR